MKSSSDYWEIFAFSLPFISFSTLWLVQFCFPPIALLNQKKIQNWKEPRALDTCSRGLGPSSGQITLLSSWPSCFPPIMPLFTQKTVRGTRKIRSHALNIGICFVIDCKNQLPGSSVLTSVFFYRLQRQNEKQTNRRWIQKLFLTRMSLKVRKMACSTENEQASCKNTFVKK